MDTTSLHHFARAPALARVSRKKAEQEYEQEHEYEHEWK
jgi:hypothetical protein